MKTLSVEERLSALEAAVAALKPQAAIDLNDPYSDIVCFRSPPKWIEAGGPDYAGVKISQTTPEFCDAMASFLDWKAGKEAAENKTYTKKATGEMLPVAPLTRKDASRCRAWSKRLREQAPARRGAPVQQGFGSDDGEIPF